MFLSRRGRSMKVFFFWGGKLSLFSERTFHDLSFCGRDVSLSLVGYSLAHIFFSTWRRKTEIFFGALFFPRRRLFFWLSDTSPKGMKAMYCIFTSSLVVFGLLQNDMGCTVQFLYVRTTPCRIITNKKKSSSDPELFAANGGNVIAGVICWHGFPWVFRVNALPAPPSDSEFRAWLWALCWHWR